MLVLNKKWQELSLTIKKLNVITNACTVIAKQ